MTDIQVKVGVVVVVKKKAGRKVISRVEFDTIAKLGVYARGTLADASFDSFPSVT